MNKLIDVAKKYINAGISVIATDLNKRAVMPWKKYEQNFATELDLKEMFVNRNAEGIAILCGKLSGNLEVIDVDCKYDLSNTLFQNLIQEITDANADIAQKIVIAETKSGGYHIYYRCKEIDGNKKLAQRFTTDEEKSKNPHEKVKVLIETRGQSGYVIAPPTEGYKFIQGNINNIPEITTDERMVILEISRSFNEVIEEVKPHDYIEKKPFQKSPFTDYNERGDIVGLLCDHGWKKIKEQGAKTIFLRPGETTSKSSGDYNRDMNLFSVFTTSSQFEPNKGYRPSAVYAMLECGNDWKLAAKKLLAEGYGEPFKSYTRDLVKTIDNLRDKGFSGDELLVETVRLKKVTLNEAKEAVSIADKVSNSDCFWIWDTKKKFVSILYTRFVDFLINEGFGLFFYDKTSNVFKIIRCVDNLIEETTTERIKKHVELFIKNYNIDNDLFSKEDLLEQVYRNGLMFSQSILDYLRPIDLDFLEDTKDECFIPFKNVIVKINASGASLINHGDVKKVIWKQDLIDFHIDLNINDDNDCEFLTFLEKVTGQDDNRLKSALSIIGYVLHKYKYQDRAFAVVLGEEADDDSKGGGTGKGIFTKAFEYMIPCVTVDGKTFNPSSKNFAYQRLKLNTKGMIIQDIVKKFDFHTLYALITEGATIEKKNQDELFIPYKDSPKIIITTNYTIPDDSNHAKRRLKVVEFSNHYTPTHTPADEFGHLLFVDWDKDEWNRFYNLMFFCIQYYIKFGIFDIPQSEGYKLKKIKSQFGEDFADWINHYSKNGCGTFKMISDLHKDFLTESDMDSKDYSVKRFSKAMEVGAGCLGFVFEKSRNIEPTRRVFARLTR